jgi:hypothetical protein
MIRSLLFVSFIVVASCSNYKGVFSAGYPQCAWKGTACRAYSECCSDFCVNGFCEQRED